MTAMNQCRPKLPVFDMMAWLTARLESFLEERPSGRNGMKSQLRKASTVDDGLPKGMDVLVIMLDPMSRGHLERSMPQTKKVLQDLGFLSFTKYSAVGDNSGPNQAALYSGKPLSDRDGISKKRSDGKSDWLWDTLRASRLRHFEGRGRLY